MACVWHDVSGRQMSICMFGMQTTSFESMHNTCAEKFTDLISVAALCISVAMQSQNL